MKNKNIMFYLKTTLVYTIIYFILIALGQFNIFSFLGGMIYLQCTNKIREKHFNNVQD